MDGGRTPFLRDDKVVMKSEGCKTISSFVIFKVFTAVTIRMASSGMLRRVALVRT
jgi:hypothetical protein